MFHLKKSKKWSIIIIWVVALFICISLPIIFDFRTRDSDSKLYTNMSGELADRPLEKWIAPEWAGNWNRQGLFFEHPPGMLWLGATGIRLGIPKHQALYVINFLSYFISLFLLFKIAKRKCDNSIDGTENNLDLIAPTVWILTPGFCQYIIRGNHEHPMALALMMMMYVLLVGEYISFIKAFIIWSTAIVLAVFIKGLAGIGLVIIFLTGYILFFRSRKIILVFLMGLIVLFVVWAFFEKRYFAETGTFFIVNYFKAQVSHSVGTATIFIVFQKFYNLLFYLARPLWFFFPWINFIIYGIYLHYRRREFIGTEPFFWLGVISLIVFIFGFSMADRKADRYIFPAYPALALSTAWLISNRSWSFCNKIQSFVDKNRKRLIYAIPLFLIIAVCIEMYFGTYHYKFIRIWKGS